MYYTAHKLHVKHQYRNYFSIRSLSIRRNHMKYELQKKHCTGNLLLQRFAVAINSDISVSATTKLHE